MVNVPVWLWIATCAGVLGLLAIELLFVGLKPHRVSVGEAARWVTFYVGCALVFAAGVWYFAGSEHGWKFTAGYITEYSLSVDNLFVFIIIITAFRVPAIYEQYVLLFGVLVALVLRGVFIAIGAAAIALFSWVFYLFGALLIVTAWKLARQRHDEQAFHENVVLRGVRRVLPVTDDYRGGKAVLREAGKWLVTPMFIVMVAIGTTDVLFALDSIPAIYGLTKEPYLVFTANAFALMGLRQLYFLLGGLLRKLIYLSVGLAVILGFIGVKLVLEALHENTLPFINGGEPVPVPVIGIELSLSVIVGVLAITTVASLIRAKRHPEQVSQH